MYELIYNGEIIDTAETMKEAKFLQTEYAMAFNGTILINLSL